MGELAQVQNNFRQEEMRKVSVINKIEKKNVGQSTQLHFL